MATLGASPHPSHCTSSGASANTGMACEITNSGNSQNRSPRDSASSTVSHSPSAAPINRPSTTVSRVTRKPLRK